MKKILLTSLILFSFNTVGEIAPEIKALKDEIKELKESLKLKNKVGKSYTKKIKGLNELVEDQSKEIEELHAMNWNLSKLLNKEIQEYNLKEYNINLGNKGGKNA